MIENSRDVLILSAVRTPIGRFQGSLSSMPAPRLGAAAIREAVKRADLPDPAEIAEVIMGNVVQAGEGQAPARQAAIFSGLPTSVGAVTVNKVCGSGMKALMIASQAIRLNEADLLAVGGMESMSRAPYLVDGANGRATVWARPAHGFSAARWALGPVRKLDYGRCCRIYRCSIRG
jgi:acetyl-CoA C-acetyltransferase